MMTLSEVFDHFQPALLKELRPASVEAYRYALLHWQRYADDPPIDQITTKTLEQFREAFLGSDLSVHTAAKTWRYIRRLSTLAAKLPGVSTWKLPELTLTRSSSLFRPGPVRHRETISNAEVDLLWKRAEIATYPIEYPTEHWRMWLCLMSHYGPRTSDLLAMDLESIQWKDNLIAFQAKKTSKLQGLPLTDTVARLLREWLAIRPSGSNLLFPGFRVVGFRRNGTGRWKVGWRTSWRTELSAVGKVSGEAGIAKPIQFKHFRQTMLTRLNDVSAGVGNWVAGHYMPGVSAQNYDQPDLRIREAFQRRVMPQCFQGHLSDGIVLNHGFEEPDHGGRSTSQGLYSGCGVS